MINDVRQSFRLDDEVIFAYSLLSINHMNRAVAQLAKGGGNVEDIFPQIELDQKSQGVNISETGMAWVAAKQFYPESHLAITLQFPTSEAQIRLIARVVACDEDPEREGLNIIRVSFETMAEFDKMLLAKHMDIVLKEKLKKRQAYNRTRHSILRS